MKLIKVIIFICLLTQICFSEVSEHWEKLDKMITTELKKVNSAKNKFDLLFGSNREFQKMIDLATDHYQVIDFSGTTGLSLSEAYARAKIVEKLREYLNIFYANLKQSGDKFLFKSDKVNQRMQLFSSLYKLTVNGLGQYLAACPANEILNEKNIFIVQQVDDEISLHTLASGLYGLKDPKLLSQIKNYVHDDLNVLNLPDIMDMVYPAFRRLPEGKKLFFIEVLISNVLRNGFNFSEKGIKQRIQNYTSKLENELEKPSSDQQSRKRIKLLKEALLDLEDVKQGVDLNEVMQTLKKRFTDDEKELQDKFDKIVKRVQSDYQNSMVWKSNEYVEGSMFLNIHTSGWSNLFHAIVDLENIFSHCGIVASDISHGFKYYYFVDLLGELSIIPLHKLSYSGILLKPSFEVEEGFSSEGVDNLLKKPIYFDNLFIYGSHSQNDNYQLYCSEIVHYMYKNKFSESNPAKMSPFDFVDLTLKKQSEFSQANLKRLGIDTTKPIYLPDQIMFSSKVEFSGVQLGGAHRIESHPTRTELEFELYDSFKRKFKNQFQTSKIREITDKEKLVIDFFIEANSLIKWIDVPDIESSKGESKYIFALAIQIQNEFLELIEDLGGNRSTFQMPLSESEKNQFLKTFKTNTEPKIESLFKK